MRTITISNQKGGVAKTTTAISLAGALGERGLRVLACDLDPQANLTMGLGTEPDMVEAGMFQVLSGALPLGQALVREAAPGVDLLPADLTLAGAERRLIGEIGFDEILRLRLREAEAEAAVAGAPGWDVCLVDSPPSLGLLTINAITASSIVLVPVQCEYFSARGLDQLLEVTDLVRRKRVPDLGVLVLATLYDQRNRVCRDILDELRRSFGDETCRATIGVDTRLRETAAAGQPITTYAPASRAAKQYRALAAELAARGIVPGDDSPGLAPRAPRRPARRAGPAAPGARSATRSSSRKAPATKTAATKTAATKSSALTSSASNGAGTKTATPKAAAPKAAGTKTAVTKTPAIASSAKRAAATKAPAKGKKAAKAMAGKAARRAPASGPARRRARA